MYIAENHVLPIIMDVAIEYHSLSLTRDDVENVIMGNNIILKIKGDSIHHLHATEITNLTQPNKLWMLKHCCS